MPLWCPGIPGKQGFCIIWEKNPDSEGWTWGGGLVPGQELFLSQKESQLTPSWVWDP